MKSTLNILCLEDQEDDFDLLTYVLEQNGLKFQARRVDTRDEYIEAIENFDPDIILSDHSLPQFNSNEALKISQEKAEHVPFILVTGAVSDEFAVNCIKQGAVDYVLKSNLSRLPSAIENAIRMKKIAAEKLKAVADLALHNNALLKINAELDSFVYSVSHNLRAPLMSVLGLLELAKHEENIDEIRSYHKMMETSITKLDETLKEILDYSRNARQDLKLEPINVEQLMAENLKKVQFMPGYQQLEIQQQINNKEALYSDYYRLSVIVHNLVSNAVKYLDATKQKSCLKITVMVTKSHAEFTFEDNGIGIAKNLLPNIFNMFFRATDTKEGSGLGLYIVKEAIEKLHGTIEVTSAPGEGTTFKFTIPNANSELKVMR
jgi:signal transduction histidine kinase